MAAIKGVHVKGVRYIDGGGHSSPYYKLNGLVLPVLDGILDRVVELPQLKTKPTDVFLFGYPKSGTHWTWEIINMLLRGELDYVSYGKDQIMLEFVDQDVIDSKPEPRVINSHMPFHYIPDQILRNRIICVMRNPKAVAVSLYRHIYNMNGVWRYDGRWADFLQLFLEGKIPWYYEGSGWFGYVKEWEDGKRQNPDLNIHFLYYEQLRREPMSTMKALADFLGVQYEDDFYRGIIDKCSFDSLREAKIRLYTDKERALWRNNIPKSLRGKGGNWKQWFTVEQSEHFDKVFHREMKNSSLKFEM